MLSSGALAIVDWLGQLGSRWGLSSEACRVHGLLFLVARPLSVGDIAMTLTTSEPRVEDALAWLSGDRLVQQCARGWTTQADPWMLVTQALEVRRAKEVGTARAVHAAWERGQQGGDAVVTRQARRLFDLVEDIASLDDGARRLSPETMRTLLSLGGRAARFADRALESRRRG